MKILFKSIILFSLLTFTACIPVKQKEWAKIFTECNIKGTFIIKNTSTNKIKIFNIKRSKKAYLPASTF